MRKPVLILAFKPLTHTRRVGLLSAYCANRNCDVTIHCLAADPRHADHSHIRFISHNVICASERLWGKYQNFGSSNYFRTQASGMKAVIIFLLNCLFLIPIVLMRSLNTALNHLIPSSYRLWAAKMEDMRAAFFRRSRLKKFAQQVWASWRLTQTHYDLIICHDIYPIDLCLKIVDHHPKEKRPHIWFDQVDHLTHRSYRPADAKMRMGDKAILKQATRLTAQSDLVLLSSPEADERIPLSDAIEPSIPRRVILNANPSAIIEIGRKVKKPEQGAPESGSSPMTFVMAGTHFETTGLHRAIDFIHTYSAQARLRIIGAFPRKAYRQSLGDHIAKLDLITRVTFEDRLPPDALISALADTDAVLMPFDPTHPNLKDIVPNRLFDAMAAQVPVLAQSGTQVADWVMQQGFGLSLDFYDSSQACEQVRLFLSKHGPLKLNNNIPIWEDQVQSLDPFLEMI